MNTKLLKPILLFVAVMILASGITAAYAQSPRTEKIRQGNVASGLIVGNIFTQPIDPSGKLYLSARLEPDGSDFDQYIWDNFTLQSNETVTDIEWIGGYDPLKFGMGGPVVDFTVAIYPSIAAGTEPAVAFPPLVTYQTGGDAGQTSIGMVGTIEMYSYTFHLPVAFSASAGVKYWVHIKAFQNGSGPDWGLAAGTGGNMSHYRWGSGAGGDSGFRTVPGDAAFSLLGPVPDGPKDIFLSNTMVFENQPINKVVGGLTANHPNPNATFTFSLTCAVAGADDGSFNILGTDLRTSAVFDFETKSSYNICIRVSDQGGLIFDKNFIITVKNLNEAPTDISISANSVDENQPANTVVGALTGTDPDAGATFTFSLACATAGADDGSFNILGANLRTSAVFDFETKSSYNLCIRVTDHGGLSFDKSFVVTVNNINENAAPTDISLSNASVEENRPANTLVGALTATDPDAGATFTFSLACMATGVDDGSFNILGADLRTSVMFDFETKSSYNICIRVTDQGGLSFDKSFVVTVNNINENTAPTGIFLSNASVDENQPANTVVGALTAADPDAGATFTFGLACAVAGADDGSFNVLGLELRTSEAFDFEAKSVYDICIRVTDQGGLSFDKSFAINVNNVNETPTHIFLPMIRAAENQPANTVVGALTAADPDAGATFTFGLACAVAGADDSFFNIQGSDLRTSAVFDFETKSSYDICIRASDQGGLTFDKSFIISVSDVNEAPTDISLSGNSIDENQPANTVVGVLSATDPDVGETFTFSLACATAGADDGAFNILGTDLRASATFDFETKSAYNLCIRVTDQGGLSFEKGVVVIVNDVNEGMNTPGSVTGGGVIGLSKARERITFGFNINFKDSDSAPKGNLIYQDHLANLRLKATSFELLVIDGNYAWFAGTGILNGDKEVGFIIKIEASPETFYVSIPELDGYEAGGALSGGNLTIH